MFSVLTHRDRLDGRPYRRWRCFRVRPFERRRAV